VAADHDSLLARRSRELQSAAARIRRHPAVCQLERPRPQEVRARIVRDFDRLAANGIFVVNLSPGRGEPKYLSPEHMDQVKFTVAGSGEARDAAVDPGRIRLPQRVCRRQYQQAIPATRHAGHRRRYPGPRGAGPDAHHAGAARHAGDLRDQDVHRPKIQGVIPIPVPPDGQLKWTVPPKARPPTSPAFPGKWCFVRHIYVSSPTRNFNREDGTRAKDALYSLIDYLDPEATAPS
jgi:hypothetical protein